VSGTRLSERYRGVDRRDKVKHHGFPDCLPIHRVKRHHRMYGNDTIATLWV